MAYHGILTDIINEIWDRPALGPSRRQSLLEAFERSPPATDADTARRPDIAHLNQSAATGHVTVLGTQELPSNDTVNANGSVVTLSIRNIGAFGNGNIRHVSGVTLPMTLSVQGWPGRLTIGMREWRLHFGKVHTQAGWQTSSLFVDGFSDTGETCAGLDPKIFDLLPLRHEETKNFVQQFGTVIFSLRDMLGCRNQYGSLWRQMDQCLEMTVEMRIISFLQHFISPFTHLRRVVFLVGNDCGIKEGRPWVKHSPVRLACMLAEGQHIVEKDSNWYHEAKLLDFLCDLVALARREGLFPGIEFVFAGLA